MHTTIDKLFVIRELSTGKLLKFGNKVAWVSSLAAKNAFGINSVSCDMFGNIKGYAGIKGYVGVFDNQNEYVIEEIN